MIERIAGQRALIRVDWNVPIGPHGEVLDSFRIEASWPTIEAVRRAGAKQIVVLTHLGSPVVRPREEITRTIAGNTRLTLRPLVRYLLATKQLKGSDDLLEFPGSPLPVYRLASDMLLLENLRFHPGELANDERFARQLADCGDSLINEAFSESHRSVASLVALSRLLPTQAGLRLKQELKYLSQFRDKTSRPLVMVLGGAKVHDKIGLIEAMLKKTDTFLLGGVMANTFLAAQGIDMRRSLVETERLDIAKELFNRAPQKFILPLDFTWDRDRALDIGPQTAALFGKYLTKAKLIFWNGPLGETASGRERFRRGSVAVARAIGKSDATSIAAGGDTLALIDAERLTKDFSFLSTGGGAALAYLSGAEMPGLAALAKE